MKRVIFLDFDGVMDTGSYDSYLVNNNMPNVDEFGPVFDPECVKALESILNATGAQIVVSSTWKEFMTIEEIQEMWRCRKLPGVVIGMTPSCSRHRGDEIDAWLADCDTTCEYVIIDDMDESQFNEHQYEHLFVVNPYDGLNDEVASEIIEHFSVR